MASSDVRLDGGEAIELAELLSFLGDWLKQRRGAQGVAGQIRRHTGLRQRRSAPIWRASSLLAVLAGGFSRFHMSG